MYPSVAAVARSAWLGDLLALTAGAAATLAFAPFEWFPLAIAALSVLFFLWRDGSPKRAAWRGWLYGLGLFGSGASWVHISINQFGGVGLPLAASITVLFVAALAVFPALAGWLAKRLFLPSTGMALPLLVFPAVWVLTEWLRGWLFTGFPWLQVGYSQIGAPLSGLAPVVGVLGVSWALALTSGSIAYLFHRPRRWPLALGAIVAFWLGAWLVGTIEWSRPAGAVLRASLLQGNVSQTLKWDPQQRGPTMELYARLTRSHWDSDLIVWPETALPAFYHEVADGFLAQLAEEARKNRTDLLIGMPVQDPESRRYYNSTVAIGKETAMYHKRHLAPFGEYLPLKALLAGAMDFLQIPMSDFSAGADDQPNLSAAGYRVGVSICYEDAFGEEVSDALPDAHLLVNQSNDAWFGDSLAPHQHLEIARMRALENGRYLLRATNNGVSAVIDSAGRVLAKSPQFETHVLTQDVAPLTGATPYARFGDLPVVSAAMFILAILAANAALQRRRVSKAGVM